MKKKQDYSIMIQYTSSTILISFNFHFWCFDSHSCRHLDSSISNTSNKQMVAITAPANRCAYSNSPPQFVFQLLTSSILELRWVTNYKTCEKKQNTPDFWIRIGFQTINHVIVVVLFFKIEYCGWYIAGWPESWHSIRKTMIWREIKIYV